MLGLPARRDAHGAAQRMPTPSAFASAHTCTVRVGRLRVWWVDSQYLGTTSSGAEGMMSEEAWACGQPNAGGYGASAHATRPLAPAIMDHELRHADAHLHGRPAAAGGMACRLHHLGPSGLKAAAGCSTHHSNTLPGNWRAGVNVPWRAPRRLRSDAEVPSICRVWST